MQAYSLWEEFDSAAQEYTLSQLRIVWEVRLVRCSLLLATCRRLRNVHRHAVLLYIVRKCTTKPHSMQISDFLQDHDTAQQCVALLAAALHTLQLGSTCPGVDAAALVDERVNSLLLHGVLQHTPDLTGILLHSLPFDLFERILDCAMLHGGLDVSGTLFASPVLEVCCRAELPKLAPRLQRLHLCGCSISASNLGSVTSAFVELTGLQHLDLSCNRLAHADATTLGASLPKLRSLQALDVFGAEMHDEGAALVLAGAARLEHLSALDMGCNAVSGGTLECFQCLPAMRALHTLAIGCHPTQPDVTSRLNAHIAGGPARSAARSTASSGQAARGLLASDLRRHNRLGKTGMAQCSMQLQACAGLRHLDVSGCGCGPHGGTALAAALSALTTLSRLDAAHNALLDVSAARVAGALQACTGLRWLDLSWNSISGPRCVLALKGLPSLRHLDLRVNDLHDVCVLALAGTFRLATDGGAQRDVLGRDLEYLDVSYNDVRHGSMGTLLVQAVSLPAVAVLRVAGNTIADSDAARLAECQAQLARVREIDVAWCRLSAGAKAALRGAAARASGGRCQLVTEECGPFGPDALVLRDQQMDLNA